MGAVGGGVCSVQHMALAYLLPQRTLGDYQDHASIAKAMNGAGLSHQVNITALTGVVPASGEAVVLHRRQGAWAVSHRWLP